MRAREPEDRMAFYIAIERVAPHVWADLRSLSERCAVERRTVASEDIAAFLQRYGLDPGCKWLVDDVTQEARSAFVGVPTSAGFFPTHDKVLCLSWEPGDSGEDRAAFLKRAREALDSYAGQVETWRREMGIELPRRERDRGEVETGAPRWDLLVSRLVLRQKYDAIGAEVGISPQAAKKHVEALAVRLGIALPVRQLKPST